jgi:hypothetical protein
MDRDRSNANEQPPSKRPSTIYRLIWKAARARKQITCIYGGCYREAVPAHLGLQDARAGGRIRVSIRRRHHVEAAATRRLALLRPRRRDGVALRDGRWHSGTHHTKTQTCIQFVDVDVNVPDTLKRRQPLTFGSPDLRPPRRAGE